MCSYPFLWHVVQQMFSVMCWLFVVLCKPHRKNWILPQESVNASDLWQHMRAFGGELYFLLWNNGFKPTLVIKHCKYQYVWSFLKQKSLPHEGPFYFFMGAISTILKWLVDGCLWHWVAHYCRLFLWNLYSFFMSTHHSYHDAIYNHR